MAKYKKGGLACQSNIGHLLRGMMQTVVVGAAGISLGIEAFLIHGEYCFVSCMTCYRFDTLKMYPYLEAL